MHIAVKLRFTGYCCCAPFAEAPASVEAAEYIHRFRYS